MNPLQQKMYSTMYKVLGSRLVLLWVLVAVVCLAKAQNNLDLQGMDGGFPSLDSMLQWAVGHSDPEKLKAAAVEAQILSPEELEKRRVEIKGLMEDLRMPSDAALMKIAIADINNSSLSTEGHYRALLELLELVGPIDNANDLNKLGGLTALVKELNREEKELRTIAAWVLGQASTNNPVVQKQIIELNVLPKLMGMVKSSCSEEAVKALYAVSAIIRNNLDGQAVFYFEGGAHMLQDIMANDSSDIRLRRKSVVVVADLAEQQFELEASGAKSIFEASKEYLKSVVDLMAVPDLDIQEKALVALSRLLQVSDKNIEILRDFGQLELALERLRFRLRELMLDENQGDFLRDIEAQRQEVEFMLRKKL